MNVAVLDYQNNAVDIIHVDEFDMDRYENVGEYLQKKCGYNLDEIGWMDNARRVNFLEDSDFVEED